MSAALRIVSGLTGALSAIESLALKVGACLVCGERERGSPANAALAALDVLGGSWLTFLAAIEA